MQPYLVPSFGVSATRLTPAGLGDTKPVADNETPGRPGAESARGVGQEAGRPASHA
jgi:outer membrane protein OmpA-like peptidoglycan-associated protein